MLGEKRRSGKHNRAGLVLAMAIASSNTSGHTSNGHACVCLGCEGQSRTGIDRQAQAQTHPCQPCRAAVIRLV
jgi:hypothetical protein